ncbi:uncharacterized protein LOC101859553 [Aplysia californica]|uniref:Uncharacterized protein LOC101859553 n=1 Tax=Aplysia californica TaxID=6500 RepID=A0ABM0ZV39_APLCA|nr:uncharacterized protein LOC101859553 [Aplysia californica]
MVILTIPFMRSEVMQLFGSQAASSTTSDTLPVVSRTFCDNEGVMEGKTPCCGHVMMSTEDCVGGACSLPPCGAGCECEQCCGVVVSPDQGRVSALKAKWFRWSPRLRLCHAWILVHLGVHRDAPVRFRGRILKAAGWLETTFEKMTAGSNSENQSPNEMTRENRDELNKLYQQLLEHVASIRVRGEPSRVEIESVRSRLLDLLELSGVKDAEIPQFEEPHSLRHSGHGLTNSCGGIMSKSSSPCTPQRSRRSRGRDPSTYADMLIQQLMAQASSVTDSDTSPPSNEEKESSSSSSGTSAAAQALPLSVELGETPLSSTGYNNNNNNNNNDDNSGKPVPFPQSFSGSDNIPTLSVPPCTLSPAPTIHYQIPPNSETEELGEDRDEPMVDVVTLERDTPKFSCEEDRRSACYVTTDSGVTGSEHSNAVASCCTYATVTRSDSFDFAAVSGNQNVTTGSTPELPTSGSSGSLDIPFASLFDIDCSQLFQEDEEVVETSGTCQATPDPTTPVRHSVSSPTSASSGTYYNFPTRYSHSYARELHAIEQGRHRSHQTTMVTTPQSEFCSSSRSPLPSRPSSVPCAQSDSQDFVFHEPLVVYLPPKTEPRPPRPVAPWDDLDFNINNNYKPRLGDKNAAEFDSDDGLDKRPPIPPRRPITDSKIGQLVLKSDSAQLGNLWLLSGNCGEMSPFSRQFSSQNNAGGNDDSHVEVDDSYPQGATGGLGQNSPDSSWSFYNLTSSQCRPDISGHNSSGSSHFITVRDKKVGDSPERSTVVISASKRRKANDKTALPVEEETVLMRSARQRLNFTPVTPAMEPDSFSAKRLTSSSYVRTPVNRLSQTRPRRKKRQSPAMRRLALQKENSPQSPSYLARSPRKPLNDLYNIVGNDSCLLTTSSNSLTPSSETYAKSSDTSPDTPLPSREEDLLDRDAYYCDFTVDRQQKIESAKKMVVVSKTEDVNTNIDTTQNTTFDDSAPELLVRQVEGAESSPSSFVFQIPSSPVRMNRPVRRQPWVSAGQRPGSASRQRAGGPQGLVSKQRLPSGDRHRPRSCHVRSPLSQATPAHNVRSSSQSSSSSRSSSRRKYTTHPMASSTLIMESPEADTGSVYTWSIDEESSSCNLEKSYLRSTKKPDKGKSYTPRPATSVGRDSPSRDNSQTTSTFEIGAMVHAIDEAMQQTNSEAFETFSNETIIGGSSLMSAKPKSKRNYSAKKVLAAAPSFLKKRLSITRGSSIASYGSQLSDPSSNQATTSSAYFNQAKVSIFGSSMEPSEMAESQHQLSDNPARSRRLSYSEPVLPNHYYDDSDESPEQPSEASGLGERLDIPGKSSSSSSSTSAAARCRPRTPRIRRQMQRDFTAATESEQSVDVEARAGAVGDVKPAAAPAANQDLLDSILTDSPKSVDSSGIFAPYNSYNSPVESVGSHNGYSSTVSSSVTSSDYNTGRPGLQAPPPTPPLSRPRAASVTPSATLRHMGGQHTSHAQSDQDDLEFKRPFDPVPHKMAAQSRCLTKNQGVSASSIAITPQKPMSVRSDPLANQSTIFAVPPGVVTGPPKIKDKKSLVRKLKKFSSNFYKKTEKIHTLANL